MAKETTIRKIGDYEYVCTQFPPRKALRVLRRAIKFIGKPIALMFQDVDKTKDMMDQDISPELIGSALAELGGAMGDDELYEFFIDICENVVISKGPQGLMTGQLKSALFDTHFKGPEGLGRMFKVITFALEVNYKDFLGDVLANVGKARNA